MQNVVDHHAAPVEVIETFQWQLKNRYIQGESGGFEFE